MAGLLRLKQLNFTTLKPAPYSLIIRIISSYVNTFQKDTSMTRLVILPSNEQRAFNSPSKLNPSKRARYFSLTFETMDFIKTLKTPTNQVGFVLQLGYFRANGKFFTAQQFKSADINFVMKVLNILPTEINLSTYVKKIPTDHRKNILELRFCRIC